MNRSVLKTFLMLVLFNQFIFINLFSISMTYEYDTSGNLLEIRNEEISFFLIEIFLHQKFRLNGSVYIDINN